jgi:hypothetical protein
MKIRDPFRFGLISSMIFLGLTSHGFAQSKGFFDSAEILEISMRGEFDKLFKDTKGEPQYFDFLLTYVDNFQKPTEIPLKVRTRGHFRREMNICTFPPLLLNFAKGNVNNTIFQNQDKLKLVMPCKGEKYLLREFYVYKLYNLITDQSYKVRLVKLTLEDLSPKSKDFEPFLCFLIEEEEQMAKRNNMVSVDQELIRPESIVKDDFLRMSVFQYLIGNTDWSVQYRQNIKLMNVDKPSLPIAVPYDFDHAGIVEAPYAKPAPELKMLSVTERRYRGYCIEDIQIFEPTIELFNSKKDEIYSLYATSTILDEKTIKSTTKYLNSFFATINNSKKLKSEFQYPCLQEGTGNVVIKGLKN